MKRTDSPSFLPLMLCVGLVASLGLNLYQLYHSDTMWSHYVQAVETKDEVNQLRNQLSSCAKESTRKDRVIETLRHHDNTGLSTHWSP